MSDSKNETQDGAPANDNGGSPVKSQALTSTSAGGALTALADLTKTLGNVNTAPITGRPAKPMLLYKSRENTYVLGAKRTVPEPDSQWAVNPRSFEYGWISFEGKKVTGEEMVPVSQPMPDRNTLPDTGFEWQKQWSVEMKCLNGVDAGVEAVFKGNTRGTLQAIAGQYDAVRDRIHGGQHDNKFSAIVKLCTDSYPHPEYGRIWVPILELVGWAQLDGPTPQPVSPPPPPPPAANDAQPRRRRVA
jgi:hypothetical protein